MNPSSIVVACAVIAIASAPFVVPDYQVTLLNYIGLGTIVAVGLVLMTGIAGITSLGQAAFAGIGAYATALLSAKAGFSPWVGLLAGLMLAGLAAYIIGRLTLQLSGHYLPLSTIAWSISLYFLAGNLAVLGGHNGLTNLPAAGFAGIVLNSAERYYYLIWAMTGLSLLSVHNLLRSRTGRAIRCLRGRARMAEAFGVDTAQLKVVVFIHAALLAALSGWLYAHLVLFVNPTPFSLYASIEYLFMAVVGGANSIWGALSGAAVLTILRDRVQAWLPGLVGTGGAIETVVFGLLVLIMLQRAPNGIAGWFWRLWPPMAPPPVRNPDTALPARRPAASQAVCLAVDGASRHFGGLVAVDEVSFSLHSGEILGLVGPNGAGKSTLFNLITGVIEPTAGRVVLDQRRIDSTPPWEIAKLGVARTFQHVRLRSDMSCLENVAVGAYLRTEDGAIRSILRLDRRNEAAILSEAARQLTRVGLAGLEHAPAGSISLGQQRLLEIARALAADPDLLLLDEPAAGLRWSEKQALAVLLKQLRQEGLGILLVEHDMNFVMNLVDRVVVLDFGQKIAEGPPAEIQANPDVRRAYLGGVA